MKLINHLLIGTHGSEIIDMKDEIDEASEADPLDKQTLIPLTLDIAARLEVLHHAIIEKLGRIIETVQRE